MEKQRILVVEDHKPLLVVIQDILETEGYTVFTATDGVQALQVMEEKVCPDLILSDVMMPRMDGYALCETVRARPEWMFIPFIFLTAKPGKRGVLKAKDLGAEGYITKPFTLQELMEVVYVWLGRARATRKATGAESEQLKCQVATVLGGQLVPALRENTGKREKLHFYES